MFNTIEDWFGLKLIRPQNMLKDEKLNFLVDTISIEHTLSNNLYMNKLS